MNDNQPMEQSSGLSLPEIYYILFRHKWKIIFFTLLGLGAGLAFYKLNPTLYLSEAKLMVKYIKESKGVGNKDSTQQFPFDPQGTTIINAEVEILGSMDLCLRVVDELGPKTILNKPAVTRNKAADFLSKNLVVQAPNHGKIIHITFQHRDPAVAQAVLNKIIDLYKEKHLTIHRPSGATVESVSQQVTNFQNHLAKTEEELRQLKRKFKVIDIKEARTKLTDDLAHLRQERFSSEAELEAQKAGLKEAEKLNPSITPAAAPDIGVPLKKINDYRNLCAQLNSFLSKKQEYLAQFTPENPMVQRLEVQIVETEKNKKRMEEENPPLLTLEMPVVRPSSSTNLAGLDIPAMSLHVKGLEAKVAALTSQYVALLNEASTLDEAESAIAQLERDKENFETNLKTSRATLELMRADADFGNVQEPSPPEPLSGKVRKIAAIIVLAGIGLGLGLAFLIDLFLDQSVKRPMEIFQKLRLPLLMAIPRLGRNGAHKSTQTQASAADGVQPRMEVALWDARHGLYPFHEVLRDRLISYFEVRQMTGKPKLVAVTSCSKGAGVTTIATGLAAALSETGDGNVLLVDMGLEQGAAHPFYRGQPGFALADALESEKRDDAMIQENLYMVTASTAGEQLPRALPKRITNLVPKMKASDYDYIIFDLPPVSQTSVTSSLAGFMDMMLLVVEGEKTNREALRQAASILGESAPHLSTVFNKGREYVPEWLKQGI